MQVDLSRKLPPSPFRVSPPRLGGAVEDGPAWPEDSFERAADLSPARSHLDGKKIAFAVGLGAMAAGRLVSMIPGPAAPAVVCAAEMEAPRGETRLEQVLSCALVDSPSQLARGQDRASFAWEGLRANMGGMSDLKERPGEGTASAWPYGQVMAAALDQAKLSGDYSDFDQLVKGLEQYRHPDGGYTPSPGRFGFHGHRFMDDNAWLGLVFMQAARQAPDRGYLEKAEDIARFLESSQRADGGLIWEEGNPNPSYNTATFGPSIELSLRLYQLTGNEDHLKFAAGLTEVMDRELRGPDGLYADNLDLKSGKVDPTIWSYNQGTPVGAHLLWHEITGDQSHLDLARQTAQAALKHYGQEGLWKQPPAFNAIFFRNLMKLGGPEVEQSVDTYLDRAWNQALDPRTGLFNREGNGMGSYEGHGNVSTLDQAALTQLYALRSWEPQDLKLVS